MSSTSFVALATAYFAFGCGGSTEPRCFECGLTDEWARAEREHQEQAAREHRERIAAIEAAVAAGEGDSDPSHGPRVISDAFEDRDEQLIQVLVDALDKTCVPQASLTLSWTYDYLARYATDMGRLTELRHQAFAAIAASRGGASAPEVQGCPDTKLAEVCATQLSTAVTVRTARCADRVPDAPAR